MSDKLQVERLRRKSRETREKIEMLLSTLDVCDSLVDQYERDEITLDQVADWMEKNTR